MSEAVTPEQTQPTFNIEKLYVKDLSLEVPHAPSIFLERENPQIDLQLNTEYSAIDEGIYEVVITVTLTAKLPAHDVCFATPPTPPTTTGSATPSPPKPSCRRQWHGTTLMWADSRDPP